MMKKIFRGYLEVSLIWKVIIALILGVVFGLIFGENMGDISALGELLVRLLKSLIIPLIMFTIIVGINQSNSANLARMGGKVLTYYLFTSAVASIIGLFIASLFNPGADRKSTRPELQSRFELVCRLLLVKKKLGV